MQVTLLGEEFGAEAIGLEEGAVGEIGSAETLGEAEVVFDLGAGAGLAADGLAFDDERAEAFGCGVDAGSEARGPGADDDDVVELLLGLARHAELGGEIVRGGLDERGAVAEDDDGKLGVVEATLFEQVDGFGVLFGAEPLVGNAVAGEELADVVVGRGPAGADDDDSFVGRLIALLPGFQQVVEHGVELLFGRIPGLVEVVVDLGGVDGADRGFGVGVGGEEDALGVGVDGDGLLQEVDAGHAGHALVGEEECDDVLAFLELAADVERGCAGGGADDAVVLTVVPAQILDYSLQYAGVVVDGEQNWLGHISFLYLFRGIFILASPVSLYFVTHSDTPHV